MSPDTEHHNIKVVHVCEQDGEADIVIGFLKANGIDALQDSDLPHSILPANADAEVYVNEDDYEEAMRVLEERESQAKQESE